MNETARAPGVTIIVPAYNEEGSLRTVVEEIVEVAKSALTEWETLIVDDASTDGTSRIAAELRAEHPEVRCFTHETNRGSGGAILSGITNARCDLVIYVPADGQFHLQELGEFVDAIADCDIVIGARIGRSDYSWFRRLSSRVFIRLVNVLFRQDFRDVNWVHMWRRRVFDVVTPRARGVFLLEEILVRAERSGFRVREIDSAYIPRMAGQAKGGNLLTILRTIYEMAVFWFELHGFARP